MMAREEYTKWKYRQTGNECVMAAYAAMLWPWTQVPTSGFIVGYCSHYQIDISSQDPVAAYDGDFHRRAQKHLNGGFGVIEDLHRHSIEKPFAEAREAGDMLFLKEGEIEWHQIERMLREERRTTAQVFINQKENGIFASMHSVAIAWDANGLYAIDSSQPGVVFSLPNGKAQLGLLGHTFIVRPTIGKQAGGGPADLSQTEGPLPLVPAPSTPDPV